MADEKKAETAVAGNKAKGGGKKGGAFGLILFMGAFGAAVPFILPTMLVMLGMIPALVALATENDRQKSGVIAVGGMNLAGVLPFVIELWQKGQTMENALAIVRDPSNWLVMLGSAAIGHLILFSVPLMTASFTLNRAEGRLRTLKGNLEKLKASWGADVGTTKPMEKIIRGE